MPDAWWMWLLPPLALLAGSAWLWWTPLARHLRRRRAARRPFPAPWREVLRRRMPYFARLPADLQMQLKRRIQVFIAEKTFIGCAGLEVTDEMRVLVAAQACLLQLGPGAGGFRDTRQVLLYPGAFVVDRPEPQANGLVHEGRRVMAGESWQQGQVILSWEDVLAGAADPGDGRNVVIHEFAHQLDQERGRASGAPFLGRRERYVRWAAVMNAAWQRLRQRALHGEPGVIDPYGAGEPAEFFAVASEAFFEVPHALAAEEPELYAELARFYAIEPRAW